jgi:hypothetical protein
MDYPERKKFWDIRKKRDDLAVHLQAIIRLSDDPQVVESALQRLTIIARQEHDWNKRVAAIKLKFEKGAYQPPPIPHSVPQIHLSPALYQCPICDEFTMTLEEEPFDTDGFSGDDICIEDWHCRACGFSGDDDILDE